DDLAVGAERDLVAVEHDDGVGLRVLLGPRPVLGEVDELFGVRLRRRRRRRLLRRRAARRRRVARRKEEQEESLHYWRSFPSHSGCCRTWAMPRSTPPSSPYCFGSMTRLLIWKARWHETVVLSSPSVHFDVTADTAFEPLTSFGSASTSV